MSDIESLKLYIVELNPLAEFAGTGLFKWHVKHDKAVLLGIEPFEFRCHLTLPDQVILFNYLYI